MADFYEYGGYNDFNRFINIDGIEGKIIQHLLTSKTAYAETFWRLLKYDTSDALVKPPLTSKEKWGLIDGYANNRGDSQSGGQTKDARVFFSPFVDDAWTKECSSVYIYVDDIYPIDHMRSIVSVAVETVIHAKINFLSNGPATNCDAGSPKPENPAKELVNANDYYYKDDKNPAVRFKSRATVLLKCLLAELNGLYIDGIGYLGFITSKPAEGDVVKSKATLSLFNNRSFFGHRIGFNVTVSGISDDPEGGF